MGVERLAESSLDHADDRFDLPALAVLSAFRRAFEVGTHLAAVRGGRWLVGGTADQRRNERAKAVVVPRMTMDPLGVVAGVCHEGAERSPGQRFTKHLFEMKVIRPRPAPRHGREDQMGATVGQDADLGESSIGHGLRAFVGAARASANEVVADVMGLEAAAVDGRQGRAAPEEPRLAGEGQRLIEEGVSAVFLRSRSAAFCRVVQ